MIRLRSIARFQYDRGLRGWILRLHVGPGAGYGRWLFGRRLFVATGWTAWIGHNVRVNRCRQGLGWVDRALSAGLTRNGNACPFVSH